MWTRPIARSSVCWTRPRTRPSACGTRPRRSPAACWKGPGGRQDHRLRKRDHSAGPAPQQRDHPPGGGPQPPAVSGGQHLHRGRSAPHGGGHPGRPGRGPGVPRPLPQRLRRADAGLPGKAQVRSHQAGFGGLTKFSGIFCAFCWHAFFFYRISAYRPLFSRRYAIFLRRYRTNVSKSAGISWKHLKLDKFPGEYGQKNLLQNPIPCYIIKIHIWRCLFFDFDVGLSGAKTHTSVALSHDFPTKWCRREGMRT